MLDFCSTINLLFSGTFERVLKHNCWFCVSDFSNSHKLLLWVLAMKISLFAASILMSSTAFAGGYAAVSTGMSDADQGYLDNGTSFSVTGGYELNDNFALEATYIDLGDMDDNLGAGTTLSIDGYVISTVGKVPLSQSINLFGKVGMFVWDATTDRDGFGAVLNDDGVDATFAFGASVDFTPNFGLYAQFQQFDIDDGDVKNYSLGAQYMF